MDRQTIMETNRSLRTIKTELENLLEKGVITDSAYDAIHAALPAETPLRGATAARSNTATPSQTSAASTPPPARANPDPGHNSLHNSQTAAAAAPPSYEDTPAPSLPTRAAAGKPVISHARALYRYQGMDPRDLSFEKDDEIHVFEHMNADWWLGRNARTGREGIFPQNYVLVDPASKAPAAGGYAPQQPAYGYPAQQQQQNPYNSSVPPMAVAEGGQAQGSEAGGQGHGKMGEYGKKFGKKLGNAAVFGAGATIGSNLVNSIF